eukprot:COSAG01_NODE_58669_length_304_cov_1.760976_1_plen_93_part_01
MCGCGAGVPAPLARSSRGNLAAGRYDRQRSYCLLGPCAVWYLGDVVQFPLLPTRRPDFLCFYYGCSSDTYGSREHVGRLGQRTEGDEMRTGSG